MFGWPITKSNTPSIQINPALSSKTDSNHPCFSLFKVQKCLLLLFFTKKYIDNVDDKMFTLPPKARTFYYKETYVFILPTKLSKQLSSLRFRREG
jgi:hypothetical protein